MTATNHPWSRDPVAQAAVRAAEDAAAAERTPLPDHRDLPQAVAELRERVGRLEAFTKKASIREAEPAIGAVNPAADASGGESDGLRDVRDSRTADNGLRAEQDETVGSQLVKRLERFTAGLLSGEIEMPKGPPPGLKSQPQPADGLRTERVTLEVTHRSPVSVEGWALHSMLSLEGGESVRVVEETHFDDLAQVVMERDAALRERDAAREEAEKATALAKGLEEKRAYFRADRDAAREECDRLRARVAELEAAPAANAGGEQPQPPRGWLTKEDGEALYLACAVLHGVFVGSWREKHDAAKRLEAIRVRAIREAGGEVE